MADDIAISLALFLLGGFAFIRGLRPLLFQERYTLAPLVQLIGGFLVTGGAMIWLMDSIVTSFAPVQ